MEREKTKKTELVKLALDQHRWINTPAAYTTIGSQLETLQQDIMLMVSGKLQDHMKRFFEEGHHRDRSTPNPLITDEALANMPPVRISLADLHVGNTNYAYVEKMLKAIQGLWIKVPIFDTNSGLKNGELRVPVFKKIFIPSKDTNAEGQEYRYRQASPSDAEDIADLNGPADHASMQPSRRRCSYIEVAINPEAAAYAFDMSAGYINHLERIALWCSSCYTSRLYLLLMKHVGMGNMSPVIDYAELKDFLGMIDRDEETGEVTGEKYRGFFSRFSKSVLCVAKRDMERLSRDNKIEIILDETKVPNGFEAIYRGTRRRGNPDAIRFYIKRNALGIARDLKVHRAQSEAKLIESLLSTCPSLDKAAALELFAQVSDEQWDAFRRYAYSELPSAVEQPHRWGGTLESYVMHLLKLRLAAFSASAKPASAAAEASENLGLGQSQAIAAAPSLFSQAAEPTRVEGQYAEEWAKVMSNYEGALKPFLAKATHRGSDRGFIWIEFPDRSTYEAYEAAESDPKNAKDLKKLRKVIASVMPIGMPSIIVRDYKR